MNTDPMNRSAAAWHVLLEEIAAPQTPDYLEAAIEGASVRPQRPSWTFPGRWLPMTDIAGRTSFAPRVPWRTVGAVLIILALLVAAITLYAGARLNKVPPPFGPAVNGLIPYVANGDLYVGDLASGQSRLLVGGPEKDYAPGYSPDGTRMAFVRDSGPAYADGKPAPIDLYTMRADGSQVVKVTPTVINSLAWVTWTPDSRKLAVTYWDGAWTRLMVLDADGRQPPVNVSTPTNPVDLAFRPPDGRELLFRGKFLYPDDRFGLYSMNLDGSNIRTLVPPSTDNWDDLAGATYSADGKRIFYQHWLPDSVQLWVMNADGTDQHQFIREPGRAWDGLPAPSPDGRWIAYWHKVNDQTSQRLTITAADGTGPIIETGPALTGGAHWTWSPDSSRILMYPDDGSSRKAYLLDPLGGPYATVPWESDGDLDWQRLAP